jgi:GAF domain-containing protein
MTTVSAERLARVFVEVADTLVDEFEVADFLRLLVTRTAALLDDCAVGLLLAGEDGDLRYVAGSREDVKLVELFQLQQHQGPCLDAFRTGHPVVNADLSAATARWPRFAPVAAAAGFRSVHAFPLRLRTEQIGALNVFSPEVGGNLQPEDVAIVRALADVATIGLLQERTIARQDLLTTQLQTALQTRVVIEQAKGAVAQAHNVSVNEAFDLIRSYARGNSHRLTDVAHAIVADLASIPDLAAP